MEYTENFEFVFQAFNQKLALGQLEPKVLKNANLFSGFGQ